jgi:hypothetical protein
VSVDLVDLEKKIKAVLPILNKLDVIISKNYALEIEEKIVLSEIDTNLQELEKSDCKEVSIPYTNSKFYIEAIYSTSVSRIATPAGKG